MNSRVYQKLEETCQVCPSPFNEKFRHTALKENSPFDVPHVQLLVTCPWEDYTMVHPLPREFITKR